MLQFFITSHKLALKWPVSRISLQS